MVPKLPSRSLAEEKSELLEQARGGSAAAWEELVDRFSGLVLSITREQGLDEEDCQEAFQNTWVAFWGQIDLIREPAALASWLVITARRQAWRVRRRRFETMGEDGEHALEALEPGPADRMLGLERQLLVQEAMAELSAHCRELLARLYDEDEPTYVKVAEELDRPLGSIGPMRGRCLARLAGALERRGFA